MVRFVVVMVLVVLGACVSESRKGHGQSEISPQPVETLVPRSTCIAAVGDMMLGGTGKSQLEQSGYDYPFAATKHLWRDADIVIGNLETALTNGEGISVEKTYRFRNPPEKVAPALKRAGITLVSLANNHSMDYGQEGLLDTFAALDGQGIKYHGAGLDVRAARQPVIFPLPNGIKVGFLAYSMTLPPEFWASPTSPGTAFGHERWVREDVRHLKKQVDLVVVSFHWGVEKSTTLRDYQPALAHAAIDEGADLIIGHHPHILQAMELYQNKPIMYSLGNYTFGTYSNSVFSGGLAKICFRDNKFAELELIPLNINNFQVEMTPPPLLGEPAKEVLDVL